MQQKAFMPPDQVHAGGTVPRPHHIPPNEAMTMMLRKLDRIILLFVFPRGFTYLILLWTEGVVCLRLLCSCDYYVVKIVILIEIIVDTREYFNSFVIKESKLAQNHPNIMGYTNCWIGWIGADAAQLLNRLQILLQIGSNQLNRRRATL